MGRKNVERKSGRGKKTVFWHAVLIFIVLMCPACGKSTPDSDSQEPSAVEGKELSAAGTEEPSVAATEEPSATGTEEPSAAATEEPSVSSKEPSFVEMEASSAELREVLEYNGILVRVYKMEKESSKEGYASRAEFEFEGIPYELYGFDRNNEERVTKNIEELIGSMCKQREENPESVLADVFGNEKYRVRIRFTNIVYGHWHYYVETEKGMECVAERTGRICDALEAYSVDIDNDGRKELICNCSGSSAWVRVYRENNGVIESGGVDERG